MKIEGRVNGVAVAFGIVALLPLSMFQPSAQSDVRRTVNGKLNIRLIQPTAVTTGDNKCEVVIEGADGKAVTDVDVIVSFVMSAWPIKRIPETRNNLTLRSAGDGRYMATWNASLRGPWVTTVVVRKSGTTIGRKQFVLIAY